MKIKLIIAVFLSFNFFGFEAPKPPLKKVNKTIQSTYNIEKFSLISVPLSASINEQLSRKINSESLFKIISDKELIGYVYLDKAPSKTATFDFLVLFDSNLIITKSKVLRYREEYGGEIGSKRWLKQFIGGTASDAFIPNNNIMAIAGATISVNSMTKAINEILVNIGKLEELNVI